MSDCDDQKNNEKPTDDRSKVDATTVKKAYWRCADHKHCNRHNCCNILWPNAGSMRKGRWHGLFLLPVWEM